MAVKRKGRRVGHARSPLRIQLLVDRVEGKLLFEWKDSIRNFVETRLIITYLPEGLACLMTGSVSVADREVYCTECDQEDVVDIVNAYLDRAGSAPFGALYERKATSFSASGRPSAGSAIVREIPWEENRGAQILKIIMGLIGSFRILLSGQPTADEVFATSAERKMAVRDAQHVRKLELRRARQRREELERLARETRETLAKVLEKSFSKPAGVGNGIAVGGEPAAPVPSGQANAVPPPQTNGGPHAPLPRPKLPPPKPEPNSLPQVPVMVDFADSPWSGLAESGSIEDFLQVETAALWWVSNQSDDLLCLPWCQIERFDYQIRTALRVIGPLRGRALLSDEVGLGKTIESGLVLKELVTRGMVSRFLVLTVPSLIDQWEEELEAKFNLKTATTNHPTFKADPERFWREERAIVASLHTFKSPKHCSVAAAQSWDMLIVDEAHYLRNAASQAWKAVNATPRKFLLLLTATPVQNSLEELYHLVTLLRPGQLPPPQEFRRRFIDPKRPHQPKEPEELRRLLGQVMIRNTRANAGIELPPRRAETVFFEPIAAEAAFWVDWENDLRSTLERLSANQAQLWGRLLLQAAGSSPMAWRDALKKFPEVEAAVRWRKNAPLRESWQKKIGLLVPLAQTASHLVVFSQFLATQAGLEQSLREAGISVFLINGQTPAVERQPITEKFRRQGGVLLLTHSGTEGRNLQFCHRLVNFDLPWNPMEIEQRIGRLHRIGQEKPVEIYNLVQAGTLQAHLLEILQDKLNLFELVVGESGLILGDRFSSDDFAEEVFLRWRQAGGDLAGAFNALGRELQAARHHYDEVRNLDETLFSDEYEAG